MVCLLYLRSPTGKRGTSDRPYRGARADRKSWCVFVRTALRFCQLIGARRNGMLRADRPAAVSKARCGDRMHRKMHRSDDRRL